MVWGLPDPRAAPRLGQGVGFVMQFSVVLADLALCRSYPACLQACFRRERSADELAIPVQTQMIGGKLHNRSDS